MNKAKALTAYLAERQPAPFDWRTANCGHFAGCFVALVEGRDPLSDIAMPSSLHASRRLMRDAGGMQAVVTQALAREPIAAALAQVGDVVLLALSESDHEALAIGLCCGEQAGAVLEDGSLTYLPMRVAVAAWRVAQ